MKTAPEKKKEQIRRHAWRRAHCGKGERGQSLIEMAVALILLVPLAAGVMLLGQYIHVKQQTQAAAREAAWAATVDPALANAQLPDQTRVQTELRSRQFADAKAAIRSKASAPTRFGDTVLTTFANQELLKTSGLALTVYQQEGAPSYLDKGLDLVGKAAKTLGNLPPNSKGLVTAEVHAKPEKIMGTNGSPLAFLDPLDTMQLDFSARTVVLADTWAASGGGELANGKEAPQAAFSNRTVRNVVRPLVPTSWLGDKSGDVVNDVIHVLGNIPIINQIFTPGLDEFELGRMAPDVVPTDKLVKYNHAH
ncbi:MAG TPA: TadE family protein [Rhodanobacter sp.]|nr:TadE family protein [Rhodanobacter sp.]